MWRLAARTPGLEVGWWGCVRSIAVFSFLKWVPVIGTGRAVRGRQARARPIGTAVAGGNQREPRARPGETVRPGVVWALVRYSRPAGMPVLLHKVGAVRRLSVSALGVRYIAETRAERRLTFHTRAAR